MNTHSHDFVTVDMRGLKAALVARARAERVSVSALVRDAVARYLGLADVAEPHRTAALAATASGAASVKLSIRMTSEEAAQLAAGACAAGLSRGANLARLIAGVPVLTAGVSRTDHLATLVASSAELYPQPQPEHSSPDLTAARRQCAASAGLPRDAWTHSPVMCAAT
jgi:hypothetical protein